MDRGLSHARKIELQSNVQTISILRIEIPGWLCDADGRTTVTATEEQFPVALHQRKAIVFISLIAVLTITSALLLALSPAPLHPDAVASLFNTVNAPVTDSLDSIFNTDKPVKDSHWKSILIRHSRTTSGNASTLATPNSGLGDHFVIGNGDGAIDGEIQVGSRWTIQQGAIAPKGTTIDGNCISICLIGDFDKTQPTPTEMRRLQQLVNTLQTKFNIPANQVWAIPTPNHPAGVGSKFPSRSFRGQILP